VSHTRASRPAPASATFAEAALRSARLEEHVRRAPGAHRVLTGDRPTGPLHLGHYFGTLRNRVRLQDLGVELMVLVADYLAVGIDPARATIFAHSHVAALNQLLLPFLSLVSVAELSRNPTIKDELAAAGLASMSGLMLAYPVHQAADILFCKATVVPVGKDQLPHLELARLIARRFNRRYRPESPLFPEPAALLGDAPALLGTDGQKMSKSRGNAIAIGATAEETARLIAGARTDAERHIDYDPQRRPEVSNLILLAALCQDRAPGDVAAEIGGAGGHALKRVVTEAVNERFRAVRALRAELSRDPAYLREVLREGTARAAEIAERTLREVREAMHTDYAGVPAVCGFSGRAGAVGRVGSGFSGRVCVGGWVAVRLYRARCFAGSAPWGLRAWAGGGAAIRFFARCCLPGRLLAAYVHRLRGRGLGGSPGAEEAAVRILASAACRRVAP
jgi:tryptophanyl-tRNA synthetase